MSRPKHPSIACIHVACLFRPVLACLLAETALGYLPSVGPARWAYCSLWAIWTMRQCASSGSSSTEQLRWLLMWTGAKSDHQFEPSWIRTRPCGFRLESRILLRSSARSPMLWQGAGADACRLTGEVASLEPWRSCRRGCWSTENIRHA